MIRISNIKIYEDISNKDIFEKTIKKYKINKNDVTQWHISKKSVDARKKDDVHYSYSIDLKFKNLNIENKLISKFKDISQIKEFEKPKIEINLNKSIIPIIVGSGPSGLFAALTFIKYGYKPIVIEQGEQIEQRQKTVNNFINNGILNENSNVQFGEGGAGTFSDGKLTSGINSPLCQTVLKEFAKFGAPEEILYLSKPHIGTDNLVKTIRNMRNYIISKGGTFLFNTKFIDFESKNNSISKIIVHHLDTDKIEKLDCNCLILAIGHSSRNTFKKVYEKGLILEPKNFSVGVRIEHLQSEINKAQYGTKTKLNLPPADYKLAYHSSNGRSCYTFCMCPGGTVMASSSEKNTIVTNGMSYFARDGKNANSAVLVNVTPDDFKNFTTDFNNSINSSFSKKSDFDSKFKNSPLAGVYFQKALEQKAFILGGSNYFAPVQRFEDFENNKKSTFVGTVKPSYKPGYTLANLNEIMPNFVSQTLKEGIKYFDTKLKGFANPDSILTGMETRSSSPVRILRNQNCATNINGIYPCGEGAGYAGGIMSAAVDGIKCATAAIKN